MTLDHALIYDSDPSNIESVAVLFVHIGANHVPVRQQQDRSRDFGALPPFGHHDVLALEPAMIQPGIAGAFPIDLFRAFVFPLEFCLGQHLDQKCRVPIGTVGRFRIRVSKHVERVGDALDPDVLVKRVIVGVIHIDAKIPKPHRDRIIRRRGICYVGITGMLDIADQAANDLCRGHVGPAINGTDLYRRLVQTRGIDHLADVGRHLVDRQRRAALLAANAKHFLIPLIAQARKAQIDFRKVAVFLLVVRGKLERLLGVLENVFVSHAHGASLQIL